MKVSSALKQQMSSFQEFSGRYESQSGTRVEFVKDNCAAILNVSDADVDLFLEEFGCQDPFEKQIKE
jgi:hypothetical protein